MDIFLEFKLTDAVSPMDAHVASLPSVFTANDVSGRWTMG